MLLTASLCVLLGMTAWVAHAVADPGDVAISAAPAERATAVSGNQAPTMLAPASTTLTEGAALQLAATATDPDPGDSLSCTVTGLPPGLTVIEGRQVGGEKQVRVYGVLGAVAGAESTYTLRWVASDGAAADTARTDLVIRPNASTPAVLQAEVRDVVARLYEHGMPRTRARNLGAAALPILAGMLRDDALRQVWQNAAAAIGYIGDVAYFDTLRSFVWDRFSGDVDASAFRAILMAQISLGMMASMSPPVLDYLERCVNPDTWQTLSWYSGRDQGRRLGVAMSLFTLIALGYTDSERAASILSVVLAHPYDTEQVLVAREALDRLNKIRVRGVLPIWDEEDRARGASH
jgi:hypothetical protein